MVYAGANARSFEQAARDLEEEAELSLSPQRIMRATREAGEERTAQRQAAVERWRALPLPEQQRSPHEHVPQVACIEVDGGRVQIRERKGATERSSAGRRGFWRESKVASLLRMKSQTHAVDPRPTLPESFANIARMAQLAREIKGFSAAEGATEPAPREEMEEQREGRPKVITRNVVAMRGSLEEFGASVAALGWESGFAAAERKAFVGDGQEANWSLWRAYFSHYTPILDFVHAACYVFNAAAAGRALDDVAGVYRRWAQAVWSGRVEQVIAELELRQQELGPPVESDPDSHPRRVVFEARRYLQNHAHLMRYDEYRRQGLPTTSAHVESTIKQINLRVKGSEKFWSNGGAQALLQLSADYLSDRQPMEQFWRQRAQLATGRRCYR